MEAEQRGATDEGIAVRSYRPRAISFGSRRPPRPLRAATIPPVYTLFGVLQVIISVVLIFLVLLHSGKDAGLSGAFGIGGGGSSFGGGSMVERNLDRATIVFAILFVLNTFLLLKIS